MENLQSIQNENKSAVLQKVEDILTNLQDPTSESVQKALSGITTAKTDDLQALMEFTGYYALGTAENAFLSIDTTEIYINYPITQKFTVKMQIPTVTISVSLDGTTVKQYPFDQNASFDGKNLTIPDVLTLALTRDYQDGALVSFSGTVTGTSVTASTYFNPVSLPVFDGNYKDATLDTLLSVSDSAIEFDFGSGLQNVPFFTYNPAMYVVQFDNSGTSYTLMLGTHGQYGLACFIIGKQNEFAVTIP